MTSKNPRKMSSVLGCQQQQHKDRNNGNFARSQWTIKESVTYQHDPERNIINISKSLLRATDKVLSKNLNFIPTPNLTKINKNWILSFNAFTIPLNSEVILKTRCNKKQQTWNNKCPNHNQKINGGHPIITIQLKHWVSTKRY